MVYSPGAYRPLARVDTFLPVMSYTHISIFAFSGISIETLIELYTGLGNTLFSAKEEGTDELVLSVSPMISAFSPVTASSR